MFRSVPGFYRDGKVELTEPIPNDVEGRVIVTFLSSSIDLRERDVDEEQAADLRRRLSAFADDWNHPEMDVYDAL